MPSKSDRQELTTTAARRARLQETLRRLEEAMPGSEEAPAESAGLLAIREFFGENRSRRRQERVWNRQMGAAYRGGKG